MTPDARPHRIHVIPVGDLDLHAGQEICWCHPTEIDLGIWVHNAKDCREARERVTGERRGPGWDHIVEYITPQAGGLATQIELSKGGNTDSSVDNIPPGNIGEDVDNHPHRPV